MSKHQDVAKALVSQNTNLKVSVDELYVVWFCKTLQNWKALVSSDHLEFDGVYYEVTYNGLLDEAYVDRYRKESNDRVIHPISLLGNK